MIFPKPISNFSAIFGKKMLMRTCRRLIEVNHTLSRKNLSLTLLESFLPDILTFPQKYYSS